MVSDVLKARVCMLRGLGYTQAEIAGKTGLSQGSVAYHLREFNSKAREKGDSSVFASILVEGFLPDLIEKVRLLEKLGGQE